MPCRTRYRIASKLFCVGWMPKTMSLDELVCPPHLFNRKLAGQALLQGVMQANGHLINFSFFGLDSKWMKPIQFHVNWNRTARKHFDFV